VEIMRTREHSVDWRRRTNVRGSIALCIVVSLVVALRDGRAQPGAVRSLADYKYFRALSIDLVGRPPDDNELAAFERPDFDVGQWIDQRLREPGYAGRMRQIYQDALRLDLGPAFHFMPEHLTLVWQSVLGPDGQDLKIYFRHGQRRLDPTTDGEICLTRDETGYDFPSRAAHGGTPRRVSQAVLDARTVLVKPWWLAPGVPIAPALRLEADKKTPATAVRVCKEEAQTAEKGGVFVTGRSQPKQTDPLLPGRVTPAPYDTVFARGAKGTKVSCSTGTGYMNSAECGCGPSLERCVPPEAVFMIPVDAPLGNAQPFWAGAQTASEWEKMWWAEEVAHIFDRIFLEDRDFREVLVGKWTEVNGPLAQFYRSLDSASCCGVGAQAGYVEPEELVDPATVPKTLAPGDTATWSEIANRGPHAAGILTTPVFLIKYGSRRARAHAVYNTFLCRDFVASTVRLAPSNEPDLTKRPGCSACHTKLEPMAAYFTRIAESDWTWLPPAKFPIDGCTDPTSVVCTHLYDPAFGGQLRSAYASHAHAEAGPAGLAQDIVESPEFASCVVDTVARSFLGQPLADTAFRQHLVKTFVDSGYRMRPLVRELLTSPPYRR
jgi:hypothetical protein